MSSILTLENEELKVDICTLGAEVYSVINKDTGKEYIWGGDPAYWKRHAPVLFPLVGNYRDKKFKYNGKEYQMNQHGFARDMEFDLISQTDEFAEFVFTADDEARARYPFDYELHISYLLEDNCLITNWTVVNTGDKELFFSLGGHPAFLLPENEAGSRELDNGSYICFEGADSLNYKLIDDSGLVGKEIHRIELEDGFLKIEPGLFDHDALIVEHSGIRSVSICNYEKVPSVTVDFHTPLFGVWSPVGKKAPFVCIEPWFGRTDGADFDGELQDREFGNRLPEGAEFTGGYETIFN